MTNEDFLENIIELYELDISLHIAWVVLGLRGEDASRVVQVAVVNAGR